MGLWISGASKYLLGSTFRSNVTGCADLTSDAFVYLHARAWVRACACESVIFCEIRDKLA